MAASRQSVLTIAFLACHALSACLDLGSLISVSLAVYGDPCAGWPNGDTACRVSKLELMGYRTFCPLHSGVAFRSDGRFYFLGVVNESCLFPIWSVTLAGLAHICVFAYAVARRAKLGETQQSAPIWSAAAVVVSCACLVAELTPSACTHVGFNAMCTRLESRQPQNVPTCADYGAGSFVGRWRAALALMYLSSLASLAQLAISLLAAVAMRKEGADESRAVKETPDELPRTWQQELEEEEDMSRWRGAAGERGSTSHYAVPNLFATAAGAGDKTGVGFDRDTRQKQQEQQPEQHYAAGLYSTTEI